MSIELVNISADLALALILVREIAPYYECRSLPISLAHGCPCVCVCVCVCVRPGSATARRSRAWLQA